jgi:enterochelin esterase family protein
MTRALLLIFFAVAYAVAAPPAAPIVSPEVHADRTVTFRLKAPNAKAVTVWLEVVKGGAMRQDAAGVWSYTTAALEPDYYGYGFNVDGTAMVDPSNPHIKPNLLGLSNVVHVPGDAIWETAEVPHGVLHHHFYKSAIIGDQRDYYVYTPPAYNPKARKRYPVFYLLHGFSDDASGWPAVGRAHVILDNLIAQGQAKPMIVVMTLGYGEPSIVSNDRSRPRDPQIGERNRVKYRDALFAEVFPAIERDYAAARDRRLRAIAGLSMGGGEALFTGLNALDKFAYVGSFSGGIGNDFAASFPALDAKANTQLKLLWIACGVDDGLITPNHKFRDWLQSKQIKLTFVETPGEHTWLVWRRNLATFAPLLFTGAK